MFSSTVFVRLFLRRLDVVDAVPHGALNAYTKTKALTEVVAYELDHGCASGRGPSSRC